jgi:biotin carboxyl carrier protein
VAARGARGVGAVKFEIEAAGRSRDVAVERPDDTGRFRIVVDGQVHEVDTRQTDLGLSVLFLADGRSLDAAATPRAAGEWLIQLPHVDVAVVVDGQRHARKNQHRAGGAGAHRVTAPMPGRVLRVLVKVGDAVAHRQGLVVVEAMKMENELKSPKAGKVVELLAKEGTTVENNAKLVVVE